MLEISGDHISRLGDEDLRILVIRLCDAELRRCGLPLSALTAGGNQDAADGGIDVRIDLKNDSACLDFIPRPTTGFQVKCSDMPPRAITTEMRPKGELRASIEALAKVQGSFVVVSSRGTVADTALQNRRKAMREAIGNLPAGPALHLDFYDRERLANWIRSYPGVGLWLRERIGEPLSGWRGYGNWAFGDPPDSEYMLDDTGRLVSEQSPSFEPESVEQGVAAMRKVLASPGGIIRLIGLSGVGKTRLVQALFDRRLGTDALDSAIVAYTDQGLDPNPTARDMLHWLGANGLRSIVVVDNCNPITHRQLVQIVRDYGSTLSLITVEYDVADDEPEETQVFRLEPASEKVLIAVLERMTPHVSQADRLRIADFAGGNARIALALASTIQRHESLGVLNDTALFERLFHQNHERGADLMRAAEACALVYSFDGETLASNIAELPLLAAIADLTPKELFRHIQELRSRDLIQRRGPWRAVLPHAVANRLAKQALERIPIHLITTTFAQEGRERLLKSFSRRLGYLHDCEPARNIAEGWLSDPLWLADPAKLNQLGITLFFNLAPIVPESALCAIEATVFGEAGAFFLSPKNSDRGRWAALLHALAFESELFDRSAFLLARFLAAEAEENGHSSTRGTFRELFHLYLSGTHAFPEQRVALIRRLMDSDDPRLRDCAFVALDAMLTAGPFISSHDFSFGARSRDFGWIPKTQDDIDAWFHSALNLASYYAINFSSQQVRRSLVHHLRGLFQRLGLPDELEGLVKQLASQDGWPDGWIAIRKILHLDVKSMPPELGQRLLRLEAELRPRDLIQKVHAFVLSRTYSYLDIMDSEEGEEAGEDAADFEKRRETFSNSIMRLGQKVAAAPDVLAQLLPDALRSGPGQHWQFGRGLALGTSDLAALWQLFRSVLSTYSPNECNVSLMQGFIAAATSRDLGTANRLLDEAVADSVFGPYFPFLQTSVPIDATGADRLILSQVLGLAQAWTYRNLSVGREADDILISKYRRILLGVADLPGGFPVAVDLLGMRLYSLENAKLRLDAETIRIGRELLARFDFKEHDGNLAYHLNEIASSCLQGPDAYAAALMLCKKFVQSLRSYDSGAMDHSELAGTLFYLQPEAAFDTFLSNGEEGKYTPLSLMFGTYTENPVNRAAPDAILAWANREAVSRYPKLASEIRLFTKCGDPPELTWTPLALHLFENAPELPLILNIFSSRLRWSRRSDSQTDRLTPYINVLRKLAQAGQLDPRVTAWARSEEESLVREIAEERRRERRVDERFE